jgi:hypothetical protein
MKEIILEMYQRLWNADLEDCNYLKCEYTWNTILKETLDKIEDIIYYENSGLSLELRLREIADILKYQELHKAKDKKRSQAILETGDDFIRFLKYLIEDLGMSKTKIVQNLRINRVTIDKILNGKHYVTKLSMDKANSYLWKVNNQFFY